MNIQQENNMGSQTKAVTTIEAPGSMAPAEERRAITPTEMLQIAIEKGATVEQLERLMALQERFEANEARKAFVVAKAAFTAEAPTITKNRHVRFATQKGETEYDHSTLDHVVATVVPIMSKHGFTHDWKPEQPEGGMIKVSCILTHIRGHSETTTLQAGADQSGGKNNIQAVGSTVSYLQRYSLLCALGLATGGADTDGAMSGSIEYVTESQVGDLQALCEEVGADPAKFLKFMGVATLAMLPKVQYSNAIAQLEKKRKAK